MQVFPKTNNTPREFIALFEISIIILTNANIQKFI